MSDAQQKKLQKSLARFKERITNGSFYEAQQTIISISNRYVIAKNYQAAIELLYNAIIILIEHKQYDEAASLYYQLLEIFVEEKKPLTDFKRQDLEKLTNILVAFPETDANIGNLAKETLKFESGKSNEFDFGNVNYIIGTKLMNSGKPDLVNSSERLLISSDNVQALEMLVNFEFQTFLLEKDNSQFGKYAARLVISYLLANKIEFAKLAFKSLLQKYQEIESTYQYTEVEGFHILEVENDNNDEITFNKKLINYLQLLISVVEKAGPETSKHFTLLFQNYAGVIQHYDGLVEKVNKIGELFFNVSVVRKQTNMLQSMMGNLLG